MIYLLIISIIILLNNFLIETFNNLESLANFKIYLIVIVIVGVGLLIITKISYIKGYEKINSNEKYYSVHISSGFGRGKTYKVMNNSFSNLLGKEKVDDVVIKSRIKNKNSLESEYIEKNEKVDALYFSALGKTQSELLSEINYETSYGIYKYFVKLLQIFNLNKLNANNLFNGLESNRKLKSIDLIIIDDLERMSDMHHDMEINKMIRLIMQLQKKYNMVIITSLDTKKNTIIINNTSNGKDSEIEEFGNMNFRMKFAKISFTKFIYIPNDKKLIKELRQKYVDKIFAKINESLGDINNHRILRPMYETAINHLQNGNIKGDLRAIKSCYEMIYNELEKINEEEIIYLIAYSKFAVFLNICYEQFGLIFNPVSLDYKEKNMFDLLEEVVIIHNDPSNRPGISNEIKREVNNLIKKKIT